MRYTLNGEKATTVALLVFQVTAFLVPWLVVLFLSFRNDVPGVANYSLLLAVFAPLSLLLSSPSRNFLISSDRFTPQQALGIRYLLIATGAGLSVIIGGAKGLVWLSLGVYVAKVTEFLFDLPIASAIKSKAPFSLIKLAAGKLAAILIAVAVALTTGDVVPALLVLGLMFWLVSLKGSAFMPSLPDGVVSSLGHVVPLSLSALIFSMYFNIPRYVLGSYNQDGLLAIFTISSFLLTVLLVINNALCQSVLHTWARQLHDSDIAALKMSVRQAVFRALGLYALFQLFHLPFLFDGFWALHNNLQQQSAYYSQVFHWVLILAFGPLLFSFANYLLTVLQQHKKLLIYTLVNAALTACASWVAYLNLGFLSVVGVLCVSGLVHYGLCTVQFRRHLRTMA